MKQRDFLFCGENYFWYWHDYFSQPHLPLRQYTPRPRGNPHFGPDNPWTSGVKRRRG